MSSGGWGCPHEVAGRCSRINDLPCDPGMKGCVLARRYVFFDEGKNRKSSRQPSALAGETRPEANPAVPPNENEFGD